MRILIVASRYLPHHGGLETVVREISEQFRTAGHTVIIVTNRYPHTLAQCEVIDDIPVRRLQFLYPQLAYLRSRRVDLWLAGWICFPLTLVRLLVTIVHFQPDVVNLHYLGSPGLFLWVLHYLLRFRLVVSLHGGDVDGEPYQSQFNRWLFNAVLDRAERITACSRDLLDQALSLAPEIASKAQVIHNGVDVNLFANVRPYNHQRPYLLAVGQLVRHKGFDVLISAWAQIQPDWSEIDVLIAGDGRKRMTLEASIQAKGLSGRVHLLGAVKREQVAALMRGSLAVVIPSRREPFGIVALEAMASGRPVIATQIGGLIEALDEAQVIWIPKVDQNCLARTLEEALGSIPINNSLTSRVNQMRASEHSWKAVSAQYLSAFVTGLE